MGAVGREGGTETEEEDEDEDELNDVHVADECLLLIESTVLICV